MPCGCPANLQRSRHGEIVEQILHPGFKRVDRYTPKIDAFNQILSVLDNLDAQSNGCRFQKPTEVTQIFHHNDPKAMKAQRNCMDTRRKPDHLDIPMLTESKRAKSTLRVVRAIHHKELSSLRNGEHLIYQLRPPYALPEGRD